MTVLPFFSDIRVRTLESGRSRCTWLISAPLPCKETPYGPIIVAETRQFGEDVRIRSYFRHAFSSLVWVFCHSELFAGVPAAVRIIACRALGKLGKAANSGADRSSSPSADARRIETFAH